MRTKCLRLLGLISLAACAAAQTMVKFDDLKPGPLGAPWRTGVTGRGNAKWEVVADATAPSKPQVLKQSGEATFVWAVKTDTRMQDGFAEVKFKPVDGREDQAGGLVWRWQDADNYYVVRANALENNVVLYKTAGGKRTSLQAKGRTFGYGVDTEVPAGKWSTLRIEFSGRLFTVIYNGKQLFQVEDDTFKDTGAVGLWTKADSVTLFDDFTYGGK
ncbi:hypothetical protein AYO41_02345 [Verrucomicrobia bacterium SCGC AG-212-E04]|nr:hypothetical protein AYO41_02345 [Verrucomicrobia bacterium SCGC AG-212-E04]